jgi:hypothetical protein
MRFAIIDTSTSKVVNVVEYDVAPSNPPPGFEDGIIAIQNDAVGPDWTWNGTALVPPPAKSIPPEIPQEISDRQFFQQLAIQGIVSQSDALSAVKTGTLPQALQTIVSGLPVDQQFSAQMLLCGATVFERNHAMTIAIGAAYGWTPAQVDAFFTVAAAL